MTDMLKLAKVYEDVAQEYERMATTSMSVHNKIRLTEYAIENRRIADQFREIAGAQK